MPSTLGFIFALLTVASLLGPGQRSQPKPPQDLALYEAEILIYLIPPARQDRAAGRDVSWMLEEGSQTDFFNFYVVGPPNP